MKKVIRLTESDLTRIVKRILIEQKYNSDELKRKSESNRQKVFEHYKKLYSNPQTKIKFKNKSNVQKVLNFIPTVKIRIYWSKDKSPSPRSNGWVTKKEDIINLNMYMLTNGNQMYNTILHEMAHLIDFYLQKIGEDTITTSTAGFYNAQGSNDNYVASGDETVARIQRLRQMLGVGPLENKESFSQKFFQSIKDKKMTFGDYKKSKYGSGQYLVLTKSSTDKGVLTDLWNFYSNALKINNQKQDDIAALFANNSQIKNNNVFLDLYKIAKVNINTKGITN
jgi:hypothetical protein